MFISKNASNLTNLTPNSYPTHETLPPEESLCLVPGYMTYRENDAALPSLARMTNIPVGWDICTK